MFGDENLLQLRNPRPVTNSLRTGAGPRPGFRAQPTSQLWQWKL